MNENLDKFRFIVFDRNMNENNTNGSDVINVEIQAQRVVKVLEVNCDLINI